MKTKGLTVYVYRDSLGDCTGGGISSNKNELILTSFKTREGEVNLAHIFEGDETNSVKIIENVPNHYCAVPLVYPEGMIGPMFGGNFIYTCDSRFPFKYPVPIHDRFEVIH